MIIFDLDTLADCEHRKHFIIKHVACDHWHKIPNHPVDMCNDCKERWRKWKPDYQSFNDACDKDTVIDPVMRTFSRYWIGEKPCHVEIWADRYESSREKTLNWFLDSYFFGLFDHEKKVLNSILKMRPIDDNTPYHELKEKWLDDTYEDYKFGPKTNIEFVFDNDAESIKMWKKRGIFVFDCNQNDKRF